MAFNKKLFHPETNSYNRGSQTAEAMPLALGRVPEDRSQTVLDNLVKDIRAHHTNVTAGDIGYHHVVRALTDDGGSDVLSNMLSRIDSPVMAANLDRVHGSAGRVGVRSGFSSGPFVKEVAANGSFRPLQ